MSMILPMAPMPLEHHNGAALAGTATHPSADSLQARAAPSHASAQQAPGILLAGGASQGGDRQDTRTIDDALGQPPADLATPVGDVDLGPPQAPRRLTTHRDAMGPLSTGQTAGDDSAHLFRVPTPKPFLDEAVIVGPLVAGLDAGESVPVLGNELFADVPLRRGGCSHQAASLRGVGLLW